MRKARAMRRTGGFYAAMGELRRALTLQPGEVEAILELGWVYMDLGRHDAAFEAFSDAKARGAIDAYKVSAPSTARARNARRRSITTKPTWSIAPTRPTRRKSKPP
ncbi:MAG: hypothetical protein M5R36_07915 [Deltaproteobacteria bacterium]|nr:hypothetical protein [Deltaproteobacteria bacterium]